MLEQVDLSQKIDKATYKSLMPELTLELGALQREAKSAGIPVIIVFEGWDAAGKGTVINKLLLALDPRGFTVHSIGRPNQEEGMRPFLWRFWTRTPAAGRFAIFDRSWYRCVLVDRIDKVIPKKIWSKAYSEINAFERQLADDGAAIIKFFLHISVKEQKKRLKKIEGNPSTAWRVTKEDWKHHKQHSQYYKAVEEMLQQTDTAVAPWTIVAAHNERHTAVRVFQTVIGSLRSALSQQKNRLASSSPPKSVTQSDGAERSILEGVDPSVSLDREKYKKDLRKYQKKLREIQHQIYAQRIPVIILYEGWDAAGKGGNIRRLTENMDPRGYEVIPVAAPNDVEKAHHYLWRFWMTLPKAGHIAIFDRTWYGRVLVERVEGFATENSWRRAFREINEMEEHLTNFGTVLLKFWLHLDPDEQLRRFKEREQTPHKRWKITDEDWRNREKRDVYLQAVDEMLRRTSTTYAPWTVVESNSKHFARMKVLKTVIKAVKERL